VTESAKDLLGREIVVAEYAHEYDERQALCRGYKLGLVAAIEEVEKRPARSPSPCRASFDSSP
jgi:hypothetical protein